MRLLFIYGFLSILFLYLYLCFSPFMMLSSLAFLPSNFHRTPCDCVLESHQGAKFHSTLTPTPTPNPACHVPLLTTLWLIMRFWQGSGLFGVPGSIIPASHSTFSISKRRKANKVLLSYRCLVIKCGRICNFLIANGPNQLVVVHSSFRILEGEFQDPGRWYQNLWMPKSLIWSVLVFLYHLQTPSCILKSCPYGLEYITQCKGGMLVLTV